LELGAGFNPEFTGRENVYMSAAIMGISRSEIESRYDKIAAFADIGSFIEQPVKMYSSGMYLRLAFAVAVNVSPDILVVDEALSVGDARFQQKCMAKIRTFCQTGTVIFVSHDTAAVTELCSRAIWIESGRIRMDGPPKYIVEKYLQFMYEGDSRFEAPVLKSKSGHFVHYRENADTIARHYADKVFSHLSRHMGDYRVTALQLHAKSRIGQGFGHRALDFNGFVFFNHIHSLNQAVLIPDTPSYHFVSIRLDQGKRN